VHPCTFRTVHTGIHKTHHSLVKIAYPIRFRGIHIAAAKLYFHDRSNVPLQTGRHTLLMQHVFMVVVDDGDHVFGDFVIKLGSAVLFDIPL